MQEAVCLHHVGSGGDRLGFVAGRIKRGLWVVRVYVRHPLDE